MAFTPQLLKDFDINRTSTEEAAAQFVDVDLSFTTNRVTRDISARTGDRAVAQALRNIVLTNPGDLPNEPDFGVGVNLLLGENFDAVGTLALRDRIYAQVAEYEPRVEIIDINVGIEQSHTLRVRVAYLVRNDPTQQEITIEVERVL